MAEALKDEGNKYFIQQVARNKNEMIRRCKQKSPDLNGRGINFVFVPFEWLGGNWRWGFTVNPGIYHINKARLREAIKGADEEQYKKWAQQIDKYNPDNELIYVFIVQDGNGGCWIDAYIVK